MSIICSLLFLLMIFGFNQGVEAAEKVLPFHPGERLTFQVKWGVIPAGEAVLEVGPLEVINGIKSHHFVMTARTYPYIDLIYKVRNRIDAYTDADITHSVLYKDRNRGRREKEVVVDFDWVNGKAQYASSGKKKKPISILPGSFDPLSIFYAFREQTLEPGQELQAPVTDGKKCVVGRARVIKRETITVESGTYDTFLVEPDLKDIGGVFKKSKDAKLEIWVTADIRRIPVKIKSRVIVGSFVGELISAESAWPH
jgi:hypothetical protein